MGFKSEGVSKRVIALRIKQGKYYIIGLGILCCTKNYYCLIFEHLHYETHFLSCLFIYHRIMPTYGSSSIFGSE